MLPVFSSQARAIGAAASALRSHRRGRRFDSYIAHPRFTLVGHVAASVFHNRHIPIIPETDSFLCIVMFCICDALNKRMIVCGALPEKRNIDGIMTDGNICTIANELFKTYAGPIGVRARMPRSRQNGGIPPMQPVVACEYAT